jgi:hypothetical protein
MRRDGSEGISSVLNGSEVAPPRSRKGPDVGLRKDGSPRDSGGLLGVIP